MTEQTLDTLTREEIAMWKAGETLLPSSRMLTIRDAVHKRIEGIANA